MMETEFSQVDACAGAGAGNELIQEDVSDNNIDIATIKHEPENEAQISNSKHLFQAIESEAPIKVEDYSENTSTSGLPGNIVKSELVEFHANASNEISNSNQNDGNTVTLERIPKSEIKIIYGELPSSSNEERDLDNNNTHNDYDSESISDNEAVLDPFGDIVCDPSFSREQPQNNNSNNHPATSLSLPLGSVPCKQKSKASLPKLRNKKPSKGGLFKCQKCPSNFANGRELAYHDIDAHANKQQFKCHISNCEEAFIYRRLLTHHLQRVHSEEKPFKCSTPECPQKFKTNTLLQRHSLTHAWGVGRPACPLACCNGKLKSARRVRQSLPFHNATATATVARHSIGDTRSRQFTCPERNCIRMFKYKINLEKHLATLHPPNPDEIPKGETDIEEQFRYNTRSHKCSEPGCLATFARPSQFKYHMYKHEKAKTAAARKRRTKKK